MSGVSEMSQAYTCVYRTGVSLSEIRNFKPGKEVSKEMLCFINCIGIRTNMLSNGRINAKRLQNVPLLPKASREVLLNAENCLSNIKKPLYSCNDMLPVKECIEPIFA